MTAFQPDAFQSNAFQIQGSPTSWTFESDWHGPFFVRQVIYQSVAPRGHYPVAYTSNAPWVLDEPWGRPRFVPNRTQFLDGIAHLDREPIAFTANTPWNWDDKFGLPRFVPNRTQQLDSRAHALREPIAFTPNTAWNWDDKFGLPRFVPNRTQQLDGRGFLLREPIAFTPSTLSEYQPFDRPRSVRARVHLSDGIAVALAPTATITPSELGWEGKFWAAPTKQSKPWLLEGVAWDPHLPDAVAVADSSGAFDSTWSAPLASITFQYQSISQAPPRAPSGTVTGSTEEQWGQPLFGRAFLYQDYARGLPVIVPPTPSSGSFDSSWSGPTARLHFFYQAKAEAPRPPSGSITGGFTEEWSQPLFGRPFLYQDYVKGLFFYPPATTPDIMGWEHKWWTAHSKQRTPHLYPAMFIPYYPYEGGTVTPVATRYPVYFFSSFGMTGGTPLDQGT